VTSATWPIPVSPTARWPVVRLRLARNPDVCARHDAVRLTGRELATWHAVTRAVSGRVRSMRPCWTTGPLVAAAMARM